MQVSMTSQAPGHMLLSTPGGNRRGRHRTSYLPRRCPPGPRPGHPGRLCRESPFFPPFLRSLGLPGGRAGPGGQAGCRQVEGSPSGSLCGRRHPAEGQPHKGVHRPRAPRGSWRSPVGDRRAVSMWAALSHGRQRGDPCSLLHHAQGAGQCHPVRMSRVRGPRTHFGGVLGARRAPSHRHPLEWQPRDS